jgi:general L-amino acid transport system permease protein
MGLSLTPTDQWGGLPITVFLATVGIAGAFPLGILLALGRRSEKPAIRGICVAYIELIRGVPLISVLFMAAVMLPLFFQGDIGIDKLGRAQIAIVLFTAAYMAEVVRGGLQAVPKGQFEAALALGLGYGQAMRLVILPQALKLSAPAMVNSFISTFKDTSLVVVVGVFDLLNATRVALNDPEWRAFQTEGFIFAGLFYWGACFAMSKYSHHLSTERVRAQEISS